MLLKLSFRSLFRQKRRTYLTIAIMVIGFIILSFSLGITEGGYGRVIDSFTREKTGHIQIYKENFLETPNLFKNLSSASQLLKKVESFKKIEGVTARTISGALASLGDSSVGVEINGVDFVRERANTSLEKRLGKGSWFSSSGVYEVILGKKVAEILEAKIGSKVALITQAGDGSIANDNFSVVGILKDNPYDDFLIYLELKTSQEFLVLTDRVHKLIIFLKNYNLSEEISTELASYLNLPLSISPWFVVEEDFFKGMTADKRSNRIFYFIIGVMVALGILNTILMSFLERKKEFGVLIAIGTRPSFIFHQIMTEALLLSMIACLIACPLAYGLNFYFSLHGIPLGTKLEFGGIIWDSIISSITPISFIAPTLILIISTFIVALYPAIMASKVLPTDAIRAN